MLLLSNLHTLFLQNSYVNFLKSTELFSHSQLSTVLEMNHFNAVQTYLLKVRSRCLGHPRFWTRTSSKHSNVGTNTWVHSPDLPTFPSPRIASRNELILITPPSVLRSSRAVITCGSVISVCTCALYDVRGQNKTWQQICQMSWRFLSINNCQYSQFTSFVETEFFSIRRVFIFCTSF